MVVAASKPISYEIGGIAELGFLRGLVCSFPEPMTIITIQNDGDSRKLATLTSFMSINQICSYSNILFVHGLPPKPFCVQF